MTSNAFEIERSQCNNYYFISIVTDRKSLFFTSLQHATRGRSQTHGFGEKYRFVSQRAFI